MWNWNLQGTNAIMRETRMTSTKRRAIVSPIQRPSFLRGGPVYWQ